MKTKLNLLAAGIFLAALGTGFGQPTLQFATNIYYVAENAGSVLLTVQRTGDANAAVSVDYASANGTALAGSDYTATNGTLTFAAGETNQTIAVPILNDGVVESAAYETFTVTLSNPTNAGLGMRIIANGRITDNDKGLAFEFAGYSVAEDACAVLIGVVRADDGDFPVSVDFATSDLTATNGLDYLATNGTFLFAAGEKLKLFTVPILNDSLKENSKTFRVTLSNPTNQVLGTQKIATISILDNDPGIQFEFASYSVAEDAGLVLIGVTRGDDGELPVSVDYFTSNGSALNGVDYTGVTNTLTFAVGDKVQTFTVPILNDGLKEGSKYFRVTLSNPTNQVLGSQKTATITLSDNDPGVQFEFNKYWVQENEGALTVKVLRGNDVDLPLFTLDFATSNLIALAGQDYTETSGTLTFAVGETMRTITVPITYDEVQEADETFKVTLTNATGGIVLGTNKTATITLLDTTGMAAHRFDRIAMLPDQSVQLSFGGGVSKRFKDYFDLYPVEVSTNLVDWTPLTTLQRTNSNTNAFTYTDNQAGTASMRFYRTVTNHLITPVRQPTGPFAVGVISRLLTDPTRRNRYGISTNGSFMVTIWYPAVQEPGSLPSLFIEPQYAHDTLLMGAITDRIPYIVGHALANAQCATNLTPYPIVIFSPAWGSWRSTATEYAESLASHGYVAAAVDHFDVQGTVFPDGTYLKGDITEAGHISPGYQDRVRDLQFMLNELVRWNDADPTFRQRLDVTKVAAMGPSWGADTAAEFGRIDDRVGAVVMLDGASVRAPQYGGAEVVRLGLSKPFIGIYSATAGADAEAYLFNRATKDAVWFQMSATIHDHLCGWSWADVPNDLATGKEAVRTINAYTLWLLNKYLKGSTNPMPALADYPRVINFKQK